MNRKLMILIMLIFSMVLTGCRSVHIGGSGEYGGIKGHGSISIPTGK